jgi:hypothetical protein
VARTAAGVVGPVAGRRGLLIVLVYGLIQYARPEWLIDDDSNNMPILGFAAVAAVSAVLGLILMMLWWGARAPGFFRGGTTTCGPTGADSGEALVQGSRPAR